MWRNWVRKHWSAKALLAPIVVATLIGATACSGTSDKGTDQAAPPPKASENQINPKPRDQVKDGGTFTWALSGFPANFNYYELDGTDVDASNVMNAMMPQLFNYEADASPVWNNRGGAPAKLLGPKFWTAPAGHPWGLTTNRDIPPDFLARSSNPAFGMPLPLEPARI
jgi:hypothetical protein